MPIITDKRKFSFEFPYEWEGEDGNKINFPCKYLYGTYGPTIQIFFGEGQGVELPADIFAEIGNFLVQQGILSPTVPQMPHHAPSAGGKPMAVPLLRGASGGARQPQSQNPLAPPMQSMSQTINPLAPRAVETSALGGQGVEVPSLSNEEIMAARQAAKEKANASALRFRRGHVADAYVPPETSINRRATEAANGAEEG